jgi:hypothetical protein
MGVHANDFQEQQGAEKAKDLHEEVQAYGCVCNMSSCKFCFYKQNMKTV